MLLVFEYTIVVLIRIFRSSTMTLVQTIILKLFELANIILVDCNKPSLFTLTLNVPSPVHK